MQQKCAAYGCWEKTALVLRDNKWGFATAGGTNRTVFQNPKRGFYMRTSIASIAGALSILLATPAFAQDEAADDDGITITGGASLVSDYRYRGISQTDKDPAIQGNFTINHDSGIYVGLWGSSVDDYVAAGADQEIDIIVGFKKEISSGVTLDVGGTYYFYPGAEKLIANYNSDFIEGYAALSGTIEIGRAHV
jgi:uncharacterized protein (TIGR02001 family)